MHGTRLFTLITRCFNVNVNYYLKDNLDYTGQQSDQLLRTSACEVWALKDTIVQKLMGFERQISRKHLRTH
jgi:hypothetical protein